MDADGEDGQVTAEADGAINADLKLVTAFSGARRARGGGPIAEVDGVADGDAGPVMGVVGFRREIGRSEVVR